MAGWNSSTSFSHGEVSQCSSSDQINCGVHLLESFDKNLRKKMMRVNALLVCSAILAGVIVGMGAYGRRYRHRHFSRFIYLGANTLFLPIVSYVFSLSTGSSDYIMPSKSAGGSFLMAKCKPTGHVIQVVIWAFLVQIIIINTSVVVAKDDREGPNISPPLELLVQGVWAIYVGIIYINSIEFNSIHISGINNPVTVRDLLITIAILLYAVAPFALTYAKIIFKCYAFQKAQQSFALGHNPLLISVYMQQLQQQETSVLGDLLVGEDASPPPLLVTGEEGRHVEEKPCGHVINNTRLVTIDKIWPHEDNMLPMSSRPRLKDLCYSFALFKLLRCRLARYKLTNAGSTKTLNFFWSLLLKDGEHARLFGVIADELSFVNDYYYSALPISYSKSWLPILSTVISVLTIGYFILIMLLILSKIIKKTDAPQLACAVTCIQGSKVCMLPSSKGFGSLFFDMVPMLLIIVLVITTEVRDIASYICSNWTKVALICRIVNSVSLQHSLGRHKWPVGLLLHCRCILFNNHWDRKMGQYSVLVVGSRTTTTSSFIVIKNFLGIPDQKGKVKVPEAVKVCIVNTLRSKRNGHRLSKGTSSLCQIQDGETFVWACNGEGACDTILIWHVATCIFEVKNPYQHGQEQGSPPNSCYGYKIAATHLSRYCVYLLNWCPELLPDNDAWIKSLYKAVKKDAEHALAGHAIARSSTPEEEYHKLVSLLSTNSKHQVLKNGIKLGKQLVETINDEESAWKLLAGFWSEMILYVAPSDNLKGHSEAIARGGELITLLWALLFHAGIVCRPGEEEGDAATSTDAV